MWSKGLTGLKVFLEEERGAVTTDWLVLTASLIGITLMTLGAVASGATDLGSDVGVQMAAVTASDDAPAEHAVCTLDAEGEAQCSDGASALID